MIRYVLGEFFYMFAQEDICSGRFNETTIHQAFKRKKHVFLKKRIKKRREIITTFFY